MTEDTETDNKARLYLRIPRDTREKLVRMAEEQKRSLQGQAEYLLEQSIRAQEAAGK